MPTLLAFTTKKVDPVNDGCDHTYANAASMDAKYAIYQTDKLEPGLTGTIATYLATGSSW